jgi:signal transduction histidine kinase/CheY-like chemotaxis protein
MSLEALQEELKQLRKENRMLRREVCESNKALSNIEAGYRFQKNIYDMVKKQKDQQDVYLRLVFEYTPEIVFIIDTNYKLVNITKTSVTKFGINMELPSNKTEQSIFELFTPYVPMEQLQNAYAVVSDTVQNGSTYNNPVVQLTVNGSDYIFESNIIPLKAENGEVVAVMISLHDVSALHEALNAAEHASKAKSSFLAKVSHEIRTPMNAVLGMTELALREEISKKAREYANGIKVAGGHLLSLINDILDFSKIEAGKLEINTVDYSLSSTVNYAVDITRTKLIEMPILFVVNIDPRIPDMLHGDEIRIRQMLLNLLSNATKYSERGFIKLNIAYERVNDDTIILYLEVTDSGIGIKSENLNRLFGDFVQLGEAVGNKEVEGTGLGLAITRGFAEAMDGTITVQSKFGKGSTFKIAVPQIIGNPVCETDNNGEKIPKPNVFAALERKHRGVSVLLYETRSIYAESLIMTFDSLGITYKVISEQAALLNELESNGKDYNLIFISSFSFGTADKLIKSFAADDAITVLITEFGEFATETELVKTLFMPAHSADIATLINNRFGDCSERYKRRQGAAFIAPTARVLIVDDVNTNLIVAQGLLSIHKLQIDLCKSGHEAIETVQAKEYDIVFMDHMMPEMDGIEAVARIRAFAENDPLNYFAKLPIIALTANAVAGNEQMFLDEGFQAFVAKPIKVTKLDGIIREFIGDNRQEEDSNTQSTAELKAQESSKPETSKAEAEFPSGINKSLALSLYEDDMALLKEIMRSFATNIPTELGRMKNLNTENLANYAIDIHTLKGACSGIGAKSLSLRAKKMERFAKEGDFANVAELNEAYIIDTEQLIADIKAWLESTTE